MSLLADFGEILAARDVLPVFSGVAADADVVRGRSSTIAVVLLNQRLIVYMAAGALLAALAVVMASSDHLPNALATLLVLSSGWIAGVALTWPVHRLSARRRRRAASDQGDTLDRVYERLFHVDCVILAAMVALGRWWELPLYPVAYVLFVRALVYCGQRPGARGTRDLVWPIAALAFALVMLAQHWSGGGATDWFNRVLLYGCLLLVFLVSALYATVTSWLSTVDTVATHKHLQLLGEFARDLSSYDRPARSDFNKRLRGVLKRLCESEAELRYRSGTIWFLEHHKDRGAVFVLGPHFRFELPKVELNRAKREGLSSDHRLFAELESPIKWQSDSDTPQIQTATAAIAVRSGNRPVAVIRLERSGRPPLTLQRETDFLRSVSAIISNALDEWRRDLEQQALEDMDTLFSCESLDAVFTEAARQLKQQLNAAACMIVFREDPAGEAMRLAATEGLERRALKDGYRVGVGQTGACAETGQVIRYDDVSLHRAEFSAPLLSALERSLRQPVRTWMAVPIGGRANNYGVIKVVNSTNGWFSAQDEKIGKAVAVRLRAIVEKFLYIERTEEAKDAADRNLREATAAKQVAEQIALRRQDDLMVMTHQLQAPLASIVGGITGLKRTFGKLGRPEAVDRLEQVHALIEDSLALCYGTFTTLAQQAGRDTCFGNDQINALDELRNLCARLQRTNSRSDLEFEFSADARFPLITVDRNVFRSVFYGLIHNAMKYADRHSYVKLECSFERSTGRAALKVKSYGEPINVDERESIFGKYQRGRVIERTGRHHSGVGLGLWVARELLQAVGGEITVELSAADPRLSIFVVYLPSSDSEAQIA